MPNFADADIKDVIHLFFLLDSSGSMSRGLIQTLNEAMANTMHELEDEANRKEVTAMVHILTFNSSVSWLCGTTAETGVNVKDIHWMDISEGGNTDTAAAIRAILPGLSRDFLGHHAYRPIIVLITDGYSDDRAETQQAIRELNARQKTINIAVGVSGYNADELDDFASDGTVVHKDSMGNDICTEENKKFIFPVADAQNLAHIIRDLATSSLIASYLEQKGENRTENGGEAKATLSYTEEDKNSGNSAPPDGWIG